MPDRSIVMVIENKVKISVTEEMVQEVFREFVADHPGQTHHAITSEEFGDRMMAKVKASAEWVQ